MNKKPTVAQIFTVGFAIFAIYFGAGNLIFPPTLGFTSGSQWWLVMLGFLITGVGLPILGLIAPAIAGGGVAELVKPLGYKFSVLIGVAISLCIGPLFCIPRTAATTFEFAIAPFVGSGNDVLMISAVSSVVFFVATAMLSLSQSKVVDVVGKFLTPSLLVLLAVIIGTAIINPPDIQIPMNEPYQFGRGFKEGYQTMDALGSIVMAGIFTADVMAKGFVSKEEQLSLLKPAGVVAAICLATIYVGLGFVGSTVSNVFPNDIGRVDLLVQVVHLLLGSVGTTILGIAVTLACLTTSIGLTSMVSGYMAKVTNNKIGYKAWVIGICAFSVAMSVLGVDEIVSLAINILVVLYPVVIVIICMNLMDDFIKWKTAYIGAILFAFAISLGEVLGGYISTLKMAVETIPLAKDGFSWLIPAIVGGVFFSIIGAMNNDRWTAK